MTESTDAVDLKALLRQCAAGDRGAFRAIYDHQSPMLYAIALRITRQAGMAEDAVHDAFVQIWQNAERFDPARGNPEAWMISLTRYRALDLVRRGGREVTGLEIAEQADLAPSPLAQAESRVLQRCLDALDAEKRQMVVLAFVDGYSHSELATLLDKPLGTVKSWIRRGLESLRRCLEA